jgi:multidrug efflux pump subunit AcrB
VTAKAVDGIEASALALREELADEGHGAVVKHVVATLGDQPQMKLKGDRSGTGGSSYSGGHLGEVVIELMPAEERSITATEVLNRWRSLTGPIPGATAVKFSSELMSAGAPVHIRLKGPDIDELGLVATELRDRLAGFEGVTDIADTFRAGKLEIDVDLLPAGETLGLTNADLARQLRQGFHGEEAQRIQRGRDDIRVMVRYPEDARESLAAVEGMRLRTPRGDEIPFSLAAVASVGRGWSTINRTDRHRSVDITAELDLSTGANANEINAVLAESTLPEVLADHPGVDYSFEGEQTEQRETISALQRYYIIAVLVIFALMAIPLSSWLQPAIVMTAVPFGLIGAVLGHLLIGIEVSVLSLCGIVALTGVVVNDSLVMVHRVNEIRGSGASIAEAAEQGGMQRFRAILLTSLTTFASLTPLMLERSMQAQFLIPMAVSLAFGVMFATLITLFFVPSSYLILEDLRRSGRWLLGGA